MGRSPEQIIKLDANENPYGPPPEVREALGTMPFPNIYPDPESRRLRKALAAVNNIPAEHLLVRPAALIFQLKGIMGGWKATSTKCMLMSCGACCPR